MDDIQVVSDDFQLCKFSFVKRNCNRVAHTLTREVFEQAQKVWSRSAPSLVSLLLLEELSQ